LMKGFFGGFSFMRAILARFGTEVLLVPYNLWHIVCVMDQTLPLVTDGLERHAGEK
jgi:hypothetical protein